MDNIQQQVKLQQLHSQVNNLDITITKLCVWVNSPKIETGSIMLSCKDPNTGKTVHDLIKFDRDIPIPITHLKTFAEYYCQDLIAKRNRLLYEIEELVKSPAEKTEDI